jgi:protein dithiol:quinone oxidoreductase
MDLVNKKDNKKNKYLRLNIYFFIAFVLSLISVITSFYFEKKLNLQPCPMCIGQRVSMIGVVLFSVLGVLSCITRKLRVLSLILGFIALLIASVGFYIAVRQVYLQSLPAGEAPLCGPGLNYLIKVLPWQKVMMAVLHGTGECAKVSWRFLGLSIAGWSSIAFGVIWLFLIAGIVRVITRCFCK